MGRLIQGKVVDADSGQPLPFAVVVVTDASGQVSKPIEQVVAQQDGSFAIDVSSGNHVTVAYTGCERQTRPLINNTDFDFQMKCSNELKAILVEGKAKKDFIIPDWLLWVGAGAAVLGIGFLVFSKTKPKILEN
jgi:hypothetical protein